MTLKELSQLYRLNREIGDLEHRIVQLRCASENITQKITGMPFVGGISDKTAIAAEIADAETELIARKSLAVVEYNRLLRYISTIDDSQTRQIFMLHFVDGLGWRQVAFSMGGGNTEETVKKICYRFIKKQNLSRMSRAYVV